MYVSPNNNVTRNSPSIMFRVFILFSNLTTIHYIILFILCSWHLYRLHNSPQSSGKSSCCVESESRKDEDNLSNFNLRKRFAVMNLNNFICYSSSSSSRIMSCIFVVFFAQANIKFAVVFRNPVYLFIILLDQTLTSPHELPSYKFPQNTNYAFKNQN